jgi:hypothetical protein
MQASDDAKYRISHVQEDHFMHSNKWKVWFGVAMPKYNRWL